MDAQQEIATDPTATTTPQQPTVRLKDAQIAQRENLVLSDVALTMLPGDFFYLVGRVGSGKSSLIETLTGQLPLAGGSGEVCGYNLEKLKAKSIPYLRRSIGVIFQDFKLLMDRNVEKNLLFALRATGWRNRTQMQERSEEVLSQVGMVHKLHEMPNRLSGGEQQRVAIARALLNDPALLLADEPTGNLDPETSESILHLLRSVAERGKAVLMATHNYALVSGYPARTFQCHNGKLREVECQLNIDLGDLG